MDTPRVRSLLPHLSSEALIKPERFQNSILSKYEKKAVGNSKIPNFFDLFGCEFSVAEMYWFIHNQPRSGWTHEFEIRTHIEKW